MRRERARSRRRLDELDARIDGHLRVSPQRGRIKAPDVSFQQSRTFCGRRMRAASVRRGSAWSGSEAAFYIVRVRDTLTVDPQHRQQHCIAARWQQSVQKDARNARATYARDEDMSRESAERLQRCRCIGTSAPSTQLMHRYARPAPDSDDGRSRAPSSSQPSGDLLGARTHETWRRNGCAQWLSREPAHPGRSCGTAGGIRQASCLVKVCAREVPHRLYIKCRCTLPDLSA